MIMAKQHPLSPNWIKPEAPLRHTGLPQRMAETFRAVYAILQEQAELIAEMQANIAEMKKVADGKNKPTSSKS